MVHAFNTEINVMGVSLAIPENPEESPAIKVNLLVGHSLPFDAGNGQPLQAPLGQVTFSVTREVAEEMGQRLVDEAQKLPAASKIEVASASDLSKVAQTASVVDKMKNG